MIKWTFLFFLNSVLFGAGLAMDAFSVSVTEGLQSPGMTRRQRHLIAGIFALFQTLMPLLGWLLVRTILHLFERLHAFIPWIAFFLLLYLGIRMILERKRKRGDTGRIHKGRLVLEAVATSIDALSVGFTIADVPFVMAMVEALIIGLVTHVICNGGVLLGRKAGTKLLGEAGLMGGIILIAIGLEILIRSLIGG